MGIFHFFAKRIDPVLTRCTHCAYEFELLPKEVRQLEKKNAKDPVCPIKLECDICHIGFMIPVRYTDPAGKTYLFHDLKPKIKNLDPKTVMQRIIAGADSVMFFAPGDKL